MAHFVVAIKSAMSPARLAVILPICGTDAALKSLTSARDHDGTVILFYRAAIGVLDISGSCSFEYQIRKTP